MIEWFASHNGIEQLFLLSGLVGGVILLFRMILMIIGIDHHGTDFHGDGDADFKALTIQGISSFFAMFGVVGFTLYHNAALGMLIALIGAFGAGAFVMWLMHRIFRSMMRLQTTGTVNMVPFNFAHSRAVRITMAWRSALSGRLTEKRAARCSSSCGSFISKLMSTSVRAHLSYSCAMSLSVRTNSGFSRYG